MKQTRSAPWGKGAPLPGAPWLPVSYSSENARWELTLGLSTRLSEEPQGWEPDLTLHCPVLESSDPGTGPSASLAHPGLPNKHPDPLYLPSVYSC
jgi:hypothetical protein